MWTAHYAPALALKSLAPATPISALAFAGCLPDFTFFVLALLGIEEIRFADYPGCFPYDCKYPFTHSLVGNTVLGVAFAAAVCAHYKLRAPSFAALLAASVSHWFLDVPVHRRDVSLTPTSPLLGWGLFAHPPLIFALDLGLTLAALFAHARTHAPAPAPGRTDASTVRLYAGLAALFAGVQAHFSFLRAPTRHARALHAPLFAGQILALCALLSVLDRRTRALAPSGVAPAGSGVGSDRSVAEIARGMLFGK